MANKSIRLSDGTDTLYPVACNFYPRLLSSGDDLNNLNTVSSSGFYYIQGGVSHSPQDWCALIVIGRDGGGCTQIAVSSVNLFYRQYTGNPLSWSTWRYLTGTNVS